MTLQRSPVPAEPLEQNRPELHRVADTIMPARLPTGRHGRTRG